MICINNDVYLNNNKELNEFSDLLLGEAYDPESESISLCLIDYFNEIWRKSKTLELEVKKRIDEKLSVIIYLNFSITDDFSEITASLAGPEDFALQTKDEVKFENLFKRYFESTRPLKERLVDL